MVLNRKAQTPPPVWLMRQAGRYLPEYREARAKAGSFWNLCMDPDAAAVVTLQPIERFELDAAILFSDILVVPFALGRQVEFEEGIGPRLERAVSADELCRDPEEWRRKLAPVYQSLELVAARLGDTRDVIGFAGGPWTLATYMIEGKASGDQRAAKLFGYCDPDGFDRFLKIIADCVARHLCAQIEAGATAVQIFDSWAGGLPDRAFHDWVVEPTKSVVAQVRKTCANAKIIGFPRGATFAGYESYVRETGIDGVSLDTAVPMDWAARQLGSRVALQGNLDPVLLLAGGRAMTGAIDGLVARTAGLPFIANLGHGVLPETPVEHVAEFVARVRGLAQ
ncbi:MAG: uroporphyrinogen decarboxylase [Rhizomicrobium sp.]